jgi:hypothetical protein
MLLPLWWKWVVSVTIALLNFPVFAMDDKFSSLMTAYSPAQINRRLFGFRMDTRFCGSGPLHIPSPFGIGNHMVLIFHNLLLFHDRNIIE